jgi:hypothetical protein
MGALEPIGMPSASSSNDDQEVPPRVSKDLGRWSSMGLIWRQRSISALDVELVVLRETAPSRDALYGSILERRRRQIGETARLGERWK